MIKGLGLLVDEKKFPAQITDNFLGNRETLRVALNAEDRSRQNGNSRSTLAKTGVGEPTG
jgi:hypothetical protein